VVALAAACRTRARFAAVSPVVTLVLSGLGGSMVPAVLMPPAVAAASRWMFTSWAIQACEAGLQGTGGATLPIAMLGAWAVAMLGLAARLEREFDA
jgi:hypothetical protein